MSQAAPRPRRAEELPSAPVIPSLGLRDGAICRLSGATPERVVDPRGRPVDPFDVIDRLAADRRPIFLVDLDGVERGKPQLEYLQELSRDADLWVDAGVPTADAAIDILVAGARAAVLTSSRLWKPGELKKAWRLSTDLVYELGVGGDGQVVANRNWEERDVTQLAAQARRTGILPAVLRFSSGRPDWALARVVAAQGPTWIWGGETAVRPSDAQAAGARGVIVPYEAAMEEIGLP